MRSKDPLENGREQWLPSSPPSLFLPVLVPSPMTAHTTFEQLPPPLKEFRDLNHVETFSLGDEGQRISQKRTVEDLLNGGSNLPLPDESILKGKNLITKKRPKRDAASTKNLSEQEKNGSDYESEAKPITIKAQSNRKVSHSLIERRRREKINLALSSLKNMGEFRCD